jgi:hypothetical protein
MARNIVTFAAAALLAGMSLTACSQGSEDAEAQNNQASAERAAPAPANLPPSIAASRTYRCPDNSLVYVDFFTDDTAAIRLEELGTPVRLTKENGQGAFKAEGHSVAANEASTSITLPGKPAQTCRART